MARPRQFEDDEILSIARTCFLEHGPSVSTNVIAKAVGLSQAALFKRFKTKQGLLLAALLPPEEPPFLPLIEAGPTDAPIDEQLVELAMQISLFFQDVVPCMVTLTGSGFDKDTIFGNFEIPPPIRTQRALTAWFQRAIDAGRIRAIDPFHASVALMGTLHVRAFMRHIGAPFSEDPHDYVRSVVDTWMHGMALTPDLEEAS